MRNLFLIMFVALLCCSSNEALASAITQDEALLLVKSNRSAEGLSNTDVNFYITEVDTIVNNYRCPVDYEWYEDGLLVGENTEKLSLPVTEGNNSITLHVISTDDNKQGYAQIMLQDYNFIKSAGISQSVANIQLLKPALAGTTITVSSLTTGAIFSTDVPEGETDVLIPCDDSPLFAVSVSVGGIIKDYQKLLK